MAQARANKTRKERARSFAIRASLVPFVHYNQELLGPSRDPLYHQQIRSKLRVDVVTHFVHESAYQKDSQAGDSSFLEIHAPALRRMQTVMTAIVHAHSQ